MTTPPLAARRANQRNLECGERTHLVFLELLPGYVDRKPESTSESPSGSITFPDVGNQVLLERPLGVVLRLPLPVAVRRRIVEVRGPGIDDGLALLFLPQLPSSVP